MTTRLNSLALIPCVTMDGGNQEPPADVVGVEILHDKYTVKGNSGVESGQV